MGEAFYSAIIRSKEFIMQQLSLHTRIFISLTLTFLLCGCFGNSEPKEQKVTEIQPGGVPVLDAPENTLFQDAKEYYGQGAYTPARQALESLKAGYPLGPYTQFAEIKIADSQFEAREYQAAALLYEEFVKSYPFSEALPYSRLRAARSHQLSHRGVGRDPTPLEKSLEHYDALIKDFPDSVYAASARLYRKEALSALSEYEKLVVDFYQRRDNQKAAQVRQENLAIKIQPLLSAAAAQPNPGAATLASLAPVQPTAALQEHSPQILRVTQIAGKGIGTADSIAEGKLSTHRQGAPDVTAGGSFTIISVACSDLQSGNVFIYLNKPFEDRNFLAANAKLKASAGRITLQLPDTRSRNQTRNCFSSEDLALSDSGTITIRSQHDFDLIALNNPPRLLLAAVPVS